MQNASPSLLAVAVFLAACSAIQADPTKAPAWDAAAARHLLSRACLGGTPEEAARLAALPMEKAVASLLDEAAKARPPAKPSWVREVWVNGGRRWSDMSAEEYLMVLRRNGARNAAEIADLRAWWLQEMIDAKAPLREVMTLFWHGHFTSATGKVTSFTQAFYQQNQTWRQHALGDFRQMLEAVTLDPAMLAYLDLERSNKANPNENYARELLELFTLGVGNYEEKDIREVARALTGWTLDAPTGSVKVRRPTAPDRLQFPSITRDGMVPAFLPAMHDDGVKTVLGKSGKFGVKEVLDLIVAQPACGRHIAGRLIGFFGASDPKGELRERMAKAFREKPQIRPMLQVLFTSPEFYSPKSRGSRIKSPVRLLAGACRDLRVEATVTPSLSQLTVPLGQELFNPPTVKGWPTGAAWISASTLALRYRMGETLVDGKAPPTGLPLGRPRLMAVSRDPVQAQATIRRLLAIDKERAVAQGEAGVKVRFIPSRLFPKGEPKDDGALVDEMLRRLIVTKVRDVTRDALLAACKSAPHGQRVALVARMILASPEYQME